MPKIKKNCKQILYLGLDPSRYLHEGQLVHCPLIKVVARPFEGAIKKAFEQLECYSHILFTSRTAVSIFFEFVASEKVKEKSFIVVGRATAEKLQEFHLHATYIAKEECGEGVVVLLETLSLDQAHLLFPHSSLARSLILEYLKKKKIQHTALPLYDTLPIRTALPDLEQFDEIVFTSPSTVRAFLDLQPLPPREKCVAFGPVTKKYLANFL